MFKAQVFVTLRESVFDPQGNAVRQSLHSLDYPEVGDVRIGKFLELCVAGDSKESVRLRVTEMCERMLANTVIEDYKIEILEVSA